MAKDWGNNSRTVEAKQKKQAEKARKREAEVKAKEDAAWEDNDKMVKRKEDRQKIMDEKREAALKRKQENRELFEEETQKDAPKAKSKKKTHHDLILQQQRALLRTMKAKTEEEKKEEDVMIPNINHAHRDQKADIDARNVDEAITGLTEESKVDLHPERRAKAAFEAFKEKKLPELRQENPSYKFSKLNELVWQEWKKSPENPMND
mmetsp:Transcript_61017/g.69832  ORF Transcript_61017/g.69832 Transcript_61017/m.69832 type:complete len:207 (-) Transcript_61017:1804-2424(-)